MEKTNPGVGGRWGKPKPHSVHGQLDYFGWELKSQAATKAGLQPMEWNSWGPGAPKAPPSIPFPAPPGLICLRLQLQFKSPRGFLGAQVAKDHSCGL